MRKFFLAIAAFFFFFGATEIHQLLKLPGLISHFREHREEDPSMNLISFLKLHYSGTHPQDRDEDKDSELPFKSGNEIAHVDTPVFSHARTEATAPSFELNIIPVLHPEGRPLHRAFPVFHPPQSV